MPKKVPNGIKLVSILMGFEATVAIIGSILALAMGTVVATYLGLSGIVSMVATAGMVTLFIGIVWMIIAIMLWKMNSYAWYISFILTFIAVILGIVGMLAGLFGFVITGFGTLSVISIVSVLITLIKIFALVDKDSMSACKVKLGSWKGISIF